MLQFHAVFPLIVQQYLYNTFERASNMHSDIDKICLLLQYPIVNFIDLQRVLEEEKNCSEAGGWDLVKRTELHEIWKKCEDSTPVHLIKVDYVCSVKNK